MVSLTTSTILVVFFLLPDGLAYLSSTSSTSKLAFRFFVSDNFSVACLLISSAAALSFFCFCSSPSLSSSNSAILSLMSCKDWSNSPYSTSTPLCFFSSLSFFRKSFINLSNFSRTDLCVTFNPQPAKRSAISVQADPLSLVPALNWYGSMVITSVRSIFSLSFFQINSSLAISSCSSETEKQGM